MAQIYVQFEDDSRTTMTPSHLGRFCYDLASWWNVLRMIAGETDHAELTIRSLNHGAQSWEESKAMAYLNPPG